MTTFPTSFLWGAATAPHQVEGNNVNSDWWAREGTIPGIEPSGDAVDHYHRYREDMALLADAGLTAYRFGIEWARIEPKPGRFSLAELAHYRRMIDTAVELGLAPVVTLQHFTTPAWFAAEGGWLGDRALERFRAYVSRAVTILGDVKWVATINEPNMLAMMLTIQRAMDSGQLSQWQSPPVEGDAEQAAPPPLPAPDPDIGRRLVEAHLAVRDIVRHNTDAAVGWTVASQALTAAPGGEERLAQETWVREDLYLKPSTDDDFVGVQAYSVQQVDVNGLIPHPPHPDNTLVGTAYRPDAIGLAVRHTWAATKKTPILITENGIATADDERRISYTSQALGHLSAAIAEGIDVRGYLHWSALDNYEWGHWEPTFGLIEVDRQTFQRHPKPSLAWLGDVARSKGASHTLANREHGNITAPANL